MCNTSNWKGCASRLCWVIKRVYKFYIIWFPSGIESRHSRQVRSIIHSATEDIYNIFHFTVKLCEHLCWLTRWCMTPITFFPSLRFLVTLFWLYGLFSISFVSRLHIFVENIRPLWIRDETLMDWRGAQFRNCS